MRWFPVQVYSFTCFSACLMILKEAFSLFTPGISITKFHLPLPGGDTLKGDVFASPPV
jgi:hypothetical protein